jgi:hypothetical protein
LSSKVGEDEDYDDDDERRGERGGVAVEERHVPLVLGVPDDGIAGKVAGRRVLPDIPWRAEPGGVGHRGHQRGQQQDVLAELQRDFLFLLIGASILAIVGSLVISGCKLCSWHGGRNLRLQSQAQLGHTTTQTPMLQHMPSNA